MRMPGSQIVTKGWETVKRIIVRDEEKRRKGRPFHFSYFHTRNQGVYAVEPQSGYCFNCNQSGHIMRDCQFGMLTAKDVNIEEFNAELERKRGLVQETTRGGEQAHPVAEVEPEDAAGAPLHITAHQNLV